MLWAWCQHFYVLYWSCNTATLKQDTVSRWCNSRPYLPQLIGQKCQIGSICPMVMVSQSKTGNRRNRNWTSRSVWFCRQTYIYNFSSCRQWHSVALMMLLWWCLITLISDILILININISAYFSLFQTSGARRPRRCEGRRWTMPRDHRRHESSQHRHHHHKVSGVQRPRL